MTEWEQGINAFRQGRLREAADRLQAAVNDHERTVTQTARFTALAHLGAAFYALGKPADAITAFQDARTIAPLSEPPTELQINLANAYLSTGQPVQARQTLEQILQQKPGHLEAQMLLDRLAQHDPTKPLTGNPLGVTPEGVLKYLRTLTFATVPQGGLDPAQVRLALSQIERHLQFLVDQLQFREEILAGLEAERDYLRQQLAGSGASAGADSQGLTPLESLLRQKPTP